MVYHGPSRGCGRCRKQRVKCDEGKPECNRCMRSGHQCPGYRHETDLIFRDGSRSAALRATKRSKTSKSESPTKAIRLNEPEKALTKRTHEETAFIPATLQFPVEDQAACHLLANFVLVPHGIGGQGFLHYIVPLKLSHPAPLHFQYAFDACALASLNNQIGRDDGLRRKALDKYVKALAELSTAIRDPEASKQEATLASTLLCGMFETFTGADDEMRGLNYHTEGAIQLVKSIGRDQLLSTDLGKAIFAGVRCQMISSSMRAAKRPPMPNDWWISETTTDNHHLDYLRLVMATIDTRVEAERLLASPASPSKLAAMIERCQTVRLACLEWQRTAPEYWQYRTIAWEDAVPNLNYAEAEVYPGRVDGYTDIGVATVWNSVRVSRLLLNSLALRCAAQLCSPRDYRTTPTYLTVARDCTEIITDIIAGVPFHLGWARRQETLSQKPDASAFACGEEKAQKGLGGLRIIFILSYLHALDFVSDSQRLWVRGRLEYVGTHLGIRYAYNMSKFRARVPSMSIVRDKAAVSASLETVDEAPFHDAQSYFQLMSAGRALAVPDPVGQAHAFTGRAAMEAASCLT